MVIVFNTTFADDCTITHPCSFYNTSLWTQNVIPSSGDQVIISSPSSSLPVYFHIEEDFNVSFQSLTLENSTLISSLPIFKISTITLYENSVLDVNSLEIGTFSMERGSTLNIKNKFVSSGRCNFTGIIIESENSSFECITATFDFHFIHFNSHFKSIANYISPTSNITFNNGIEGNLVVSSNSSVYVMRKFKGVVSLSNTSFVMLSDLNRESSINGYTGNGVLIINSETVYMTGYWSGNNLTFWGETNVTIQNAYYIGRPWRGRMGRDNDDDNDNDSSNIIINSIESNFSPLNFYLGNFYVYNQSFASSVSGILVLTKCYISLGNTIDNRLVSAHKVYLVNSTVEYHQQFEKSSISAEEIYIDSTSKVFAKESNTYMNLLANVFNDGLIHLTVDTAVVIDGDLVVSPTGVLKYNYYYYQNIYVFGSVHLDGMLDFFYQGDYVFFLYSELPLITSDGKLSNKFHNKIIKYSSKNQGLRLSYDSHSVKLIYSKLQWIWIGIVIAALVLITLVLFFNRKRILEKIRPTLATYGVMV